MIYAYFQAVTKNRSLDDIAQMQGVKLRQVSFGNPTQNNFALMGQYHWNYHSIAALDFELINLKFT